MDTINGISYSANTTASNTPDISQVSTTTTTVSDEIRLAEKVAEVTGNSVESVIEALQRIAQIWAWQCSDSKLEDHELCVPEKEPELLISKDELDVALDELLAPVMGGAA